VHFGYDFSITDEEDSIHSTAHPDETMRRLGSAAQSAIREMIGERLHPRNRAP
jgi:hypothetical protein